MTDLDLDSIEARRQIACLPHTTEQTINAVLTLTRTDVPALVAALREARAEVERLQSLGAKAEMDAEYSVYAIDTFGTPEPPRWIDTDDKRTGWNNGWRDGYAHGRRTNAAALTVTTAERDDWRRRYEALRDGVLALHIERTGMVGCRECGYDIPCDTLRVVARVEESS